MSDSTALAMFDSGSVPAHIAAFAGELGSNLPDRATVPSLSYEGKTWTISLEGVKTKLTKKNADGDDEPIQVMKVVILDAASRRGRQFYEGTYDPNKIAAPRCWSADGVAPDKNVKEPIATGCDKCPNAVKGSKVLDNGNATVACSQHRMMAVVPAGKMDFEPLRLKIAITSDWDSQSPEEEAKGWFSFSKYLDMLKSRGCPHTAAIVTKMKFDANAAYPKIFFSADRWLTPEEVAAVAPTTKSDGVKKLLDNSWTPAGVDGTQNTAADAKGEPEPEPEPALIPATSSDDDDDDVDFGALGGAAEPAATVEAKVEPKPAAAKKTTPAKPAAEDAPKSSATVPAEMASILAAWGD
jgi:hypothetical protein